jgi:flavin reductase (DIM6/NTAB) family NADH-FMN oxidoreductase RutF
METLNMQKNIENKKTTDKKKIVKQSWKPGNVLAPVPAVLVSSGGNKKWEQNLITIAWAGSICSDPPMLSISIRSERHSYDIISSTREFVVNVTTEKQAKAVDWCGMVSGRDVNKFERTKLTSARALKVNCPIVLECPINIECRVQKIIKLGTHNMFLAEVIAVQVSSELIDNKGKFRLDKSNLLAFGLGEYFKMGPRIGKFGFSVRKRK